MDKRWQLIKYGDVPPQHFTRDPQAVDIRFYRDQLGMRGGGVTIMKIGPGVTTPAHTHKQQEEVYMPIDGEVAIKLGDKVIPLKIFDAVRVSKDVPRALRNAGGSRATIIAFGTPNTGPGDAINIENFWEKSN